MNMNELKTVVLDRHAKLVIRFHGNEDWIAKADRWLDNTLRQIEAIAVSYPNALRVDGWDDVWDHANHTLHEQVEDWVTCNARGPTGGSRSMASLGSSASTTRRTPSLSS